MHFHLYYRYCYYHAVETTKPRTPEITFHPAGSLPPSPSLPFPLPLLTWSALEWSKPLTQTTHPGLVSPYLVNAVDSWSRKSEVGVAELWIRVLVCLLVRFGPGAFMPRCPMRCPAGPRGTRSVASRCGPGVGAGEWAVSRCRLPTSWRTAVTGFRALDCRCVNLTTEPRNVIRASYGF